MIAKTDRRPWAVPSRPWVVAMRWHDLLFMHWPIDVGLLRPLVPPALEIDTHDGQAWIGVVPFHMTGVRPRFIPWLPWLSAFAEINVRTYVTTGGKPGVWFLSLDAAKRTAVRLARWTYQLPYYFARISVQERQGRIVYQSLRPHPGVGEGHFAATYRPTGARYRSAPGSLDEWLTDRYCLYTADGKARIFRGEIHHHPRPLHPPPPP